MCVRIKENRRYEAQERTPALSYAPPSASKVLNHHPLIATKILEG